MASFATPFLLSIEPVNGASFRAGFHLGSDEAVARAIVVERFSGRNAYGMATRSCALLDANGAIVDVFSGTWASNDMDAFFDDRDSELTLIGPIPGI